MIQALVDWHWMAKILNLNIFRLLPYMVILLDRTLNQIDRKLVPEVFVRFLGLNDGPDILETFLVNLEDPHLF